MADQMADYSWSYPGAGALADYPFTAAMRYLGGDGRCLFADERDELLGAGLGIGLIWETAADRTLDGYQAGCSDAHEANDWADNLGAPPSTPIFYATDFGASDAQIYGPILDYHIGAHDQGLRPVRVYGGAPVIEAVRTAIGSGPGWQAAAASWSDYRLSPDAALLQEVAQAMGGAVDVNTVLCDAAGVDWLWGGSADMPLSTEDLNKIAEIVDERIAKLYTGQRALVVDGENDFFELVFDGDGQLVRRYIASGDEMALRRFGDHLAEADWTGDARRITDQKMIEAFRAIPIAAGD